MNATPYIFGNPPHDCPPGDFEFTVGGSCDPGMARAYGFGEGQVVGAALAAFMDAYLRRMDADGCADRAALIDELAGCFVDELDQLGG